MSEARKKIERKIVEKAMKDKEFRSKLLSNPGDAMKGIFETNLPESLNIHINEETPNDIYITLPPREIELSDEQLSGISGGWKPCGGVACTGISIG